MNSTGFRLHEASYKNDAEEIRSLVAGVSIRIAPLQYADILHIKLLARKVLQPLSLRCLNVVPMLIKDSP